VNKRINATPGTGLHQRRTLENTFNPGNASRMVCGPTKTDVALELAPSRTKEKAIPHQDILLRYNEIRILLLLLVSLPNPFSQSTTTLSIARSTRLMYDTRRRVHTYLGD